MLGNQTAQKRNPWAKCGLRAEGKDRLGQVLYGTNTDFTRQPIQAVKTGDSIRYDILFAANLGPGTYSVQTALHSTDTHLVNNYEWRDLALVFNVININKTHFEGVSWMPPEIAITYNWPCTRRNQNQSS